jgi:hypothetical protein
MITLKAVIKAVITFKKVNILAAICSLLGNSKGMPNDPSLAPDVKEEEGVKALIGGLKSPIVPLSDSLI